MNPAQYVNSSPLLITVHVVGLLLLCIWVVHLADKKKKPKCESPIEWRLYNALKRRGYKPRTQTKCGPFRIDLTIGKIAIECDGKAYHSSPKQKAYDRRRSSYLYRNGYRSVLRFSGSEINSNVEACVDKIEKNWRLKNEKV